jgi:3-hydroxybutyrate dehydrogenase
LDRLDPSLSGEMRVDLTGRTALVTGASSGIGLAYARRLARAGTRVTVLDLDESSAHSAADEIGGRPLVADLSDPAALDELSVDADIVVNNAGMQYVSPVEEFPPERFTAMLKVMLEAPFRIVQQALLGMYEREWGKIVNISSVYGLRASAYKAAYVAAKHGLEGLSKTVGLEGGPKGGTSNCLCPAYVRTPLVEGQISDQARRQSISEDEVIEKIMLTEPAIKRPIEPEEVAEAALFLCSSAASFMNGSLFVMDGGWSTR